MLSLPCSVGEFRETPGDLHLSWEVEVEVEVSHKKKKRSRVCQISPAKYWGGPVMGEGRERKGMQERRIVYKSTREKMQSLSARPEAELGGR